MYTTQKISSNPPTITAETQGHILEVILSGNWNIKRPLPPTQAVLSKLDPPHITELKLKTKNLGIWDSSIIIVTSMLIKKAQSKNLIIDDQNIPIGIKNLTQLALAIPPNLQAQKKERHIPFFERVGAMALSIPKAGENILVFLGEIVLSIKRIFILKSDCTQANIWKYIQEGSIDALPIVSLISVLVGLILAFVGVIQLRMFGAEIYVSSLVAIGMTRIMGAVMTGIILAGRTGAAYAAVIGTMKVNEEIDALTTLGIHTSDFLVMPRLIALTSMTPLLVIYSDFMGMLGGFLVGVCALGIEPLEYITFTQKGFVLRNLWVGIIHGTVFGVIVAITGCYQGLNCERSAASVGLATTSAVVYSIVGIVIATACLTILFNVFNI